MNVPILDFLLQGAIWVVYTAWTDVLPGILLAAWIGPKAERRPERQAAAAFALLLGVLAHLVVWGTLRWQQYSYLQIQIVHTVFVVCLALGALRSKVRSEIQYLGKAFLGLNLGVFLIVAVTVAAAFTYGPIEKYYSDEMLRLGFASAAMRQFPAETPMYWQGLLKYHYAGDFYAATVSATTGMPLPVFYFRYLLPFNWVMLLVGLNGIAVQVAPKASRIVPLGAFLLLMLAHGNQVTHLTFRENSFSLGLIVLGVSTLWSAFRTKNPAMLIAASICVGFATFAKAPGGGLYAAYIWAATLLFLFTRRITWRMALAASGVSLVSLVLAYKTFIGGADSVFAQQQVVANQAASTSALGTRIGIGTTSLHVLMPEVANLPVVRSLHLTELLQRSPTLCLIDNALSVAYFGCLPLLACVGYVLWVRRAPRLAKENVEVSLMIVAAFLAFVLSAALFCFLRYDASSASDRYWLWFGLWILSAVTYPALTLIKSVSALPRAFRWLGGVGVGASLILSLIRFWPATRQLASANLEGWTERQQLACDYLREKTSLDDLYLHNVLDRVHHTMLGMCGRRMFTTFTGFADDPLNGSPYARSRGEAEKFFGGKMEAPLAWLNRYHIRWIFLDKTVRAVGGTSEIAQYSFLKPVVSNESVVLYQVLDGS